MQNPILICGLQECFSRSVPVPVRLLYGNAIARLPEGLYRLTSSIFVPCSPLPLCYPQWNISDYFFQRGEAITQELVREEEALQKQAQEKGETLNRPFHPAPPFDCLWLCLYAKLGELCVDPRPAVRKSAGQTLFSTIAAHGTLLQQPTWHIVVWKVKYKNLATSFLLFVVDTFKVHVQMI